MTVSLYRAEVLTPDEEYGEIKVFATGVRAARSHVEAEYPDLAVQTVRPTALVNVQAEMDGVMEEVQP